MPEEFELEGELVKWNKTKANNGAGVLMTFRAKDGTRVDISSWDQPDKLETGQWYAAKYKENAGTDSKGEKRIWKNLLRLNGVYQLTLVQTPEEMIKQKEEKLNEFYAYQEIEIKKALEDAAKLLGKEPDDPTVVIVGMALFDKRTQHIYTYMHNKE
jgi:hypothetical protein